MNRKKSRAKRIRRDKNRNTGPVGSDGSSSNIISIKPVHYIENMSATVSMACLVFYFFSYPLLTTAYGTYEKDITISAATEAEKNVCNDKKCQEEKNKKAEAVKITNDIKNSHNYKQIALIVKGTPMEKMTLDVAKRDTRVAAFMVGIAMKESKFGIYSPKKNGKDCFNYWGYRGRENQTKSGYSCFASREQAVKIVGDRIEELIEQGANTPPRMVVWKCGYSCRGHSNESVRKWIADISIHYNQVMASNELAKF
jgi:hypothetical protein